ncbi:MAG TPA: hypothetical protein VLM85_08390 [Polyangiaceae bacterium]|nr:hypothetical protein [Polyangiaceae bacterium]
MRGAMVLGAVVVGALAACSSDPSPARATVETDNPGVPARFVGSASFSRSLDQLRLTVTNLEGGSACDPANVSASSNVANLFTLEVRVDALSPSGDIVPGTYTNATAVFSVTDSSCTSSVGEVTGTAVASISGSGGRISGTVRAPFPGSLFVVTYDAAECGPSTAADAATSCASLPPCPTGDAGGAPLCIDFP